MDAVPVEAVTVEAVVTSAPQRRPGDHRHGASSPDAEPQRHAAEDASGTDPERDPLRPGGCPEGEEGNQGQNRAASSFHDLHLDLPWI